MTTETTNSASLDLASAWSTQVPALGRIFLHTRAMVDPISGGKSRLPSLDLVAPQNLLKFDPEEMRTAVLVRSIPFLVPSSRFSLVIEITGASGTTMKTTCFVSMLTGIDVLPDRAIAREIFCALLRAIPVTLSKFGRTLTERMEILRSEALISACNSTPIASGRRSGPSIVISAATKNGTYSKDKAKGTVGRSCSSTIRTIATCASGLPASVMGPIFGGWTVLLLHATDSNGDSRTTRTALPHVGVLLPMTRFALHRANPLKEAVSAFDRGQQCRPTLNSGFTTLSIFTLLMLAVKSYASVLLATRGI